MKVLVTGSAGFIGFHFVLRLLKENFEVIGIDNINDYYDINLKYARLKETGILREKISYDRTVQSNRYSAYCFIQLDLEDKNKLEILFKNQKFDLVCNLAAQAGAVHSLKHPYVYMHSNIIGFLNILEMCRNYSVSHLVYASSSSVYGSNTNTPFSVEDKVDNPVSIYGMSKKSNELMAHAYSHLYGINTIGLRFFTVLGPWGRPDMVLFLFIKAILEKKPINVFNYGNSYRDFTYISDIVEGIYRTLTHPMKKEKQPYQLYNIGRGKPVKLIDFIELLEKYLHTKSQRKYLSMPLGDVAYTFADIAHLEKDYGYKPFVPLEEGIVKFIEWYKSYHEIA